MSSRWETVIGVEVHVQLRTRHKLFCRDVVRFGDAPNTNVCPVCMGLPGALPVLNAEAVTLALQAAVALSCDVHAHSVWERKSYFYPDLPKGYQITQFERPIATAGVLRFDFEGEHREVRIRRVHMEEDAGKLIHDRIPGATAVDLNRAGTPLVEIVTEPDMCTPAEVRAFLSALKQVLEYSEVSDCNMEEGSLRADANISLREVGASALGTKTEIKNVNSFSGVEKALHLEIERQTGVLESGGQVRSESLLWNDHEGTLRSMRSKEDSEDYRYFPDPDLTPLVLAPSLLTWANSAVPELPRDRRARFEDSYRLTEYESGVLTQTREGADLFEDVVDQTGDAGITAKWIMGPVQALMKARAETPKSFALRPEALGQLIGLVTDGTISDAVARGVLEIMATSGRSAVDVVEASGLQQVRDRSVVTGWVEGVVTSFPNEVRRFREGEARLLGFLVGQVMKASEGKADPRQVNEVLRSWLNGLD